MGVASSRCTTPDDLTRPLTAAPQIKPIQIEESVARYLSQLDTADRQAAGGGDGEVLAAKTARLKEKLAKLEEETVRLRALEKELQASPDKQISLVDRDCRSMATSGRGSGIVGYNVQAAVETEHHLIVAHEVTNIGGAGQGSDARAGA
jgi:transposase